MPYAAKATVEHEFITDHLEIYVTFRHPMKLSSAPLDDPPPWDIMPPLAKWLLDADAVDVDIVSSEWLDLWTLFLVSDTVATRPALVNLEYNGPDIGLRTSWNKQWEPFGPIPSNEFPIGVTQNMYPQRATMWHDESHVLTGNAFLNNISSVNPYFAYSFQNPPANGDSFTNSFILESGTYTFYVKGFTASNLGKIDWFVDGTKIVSLQDWYSAATVNKVVQSTANIVIIGDGYHVLKGVINGKTGSDYYQAYTKFWFAKTADAGRL